MAKNHIEQVEQLCFKGKNDCNVFVLYNVNMIISKFTFWDTVGFPMKV